MAFVILLLVLLAIGVKFWAALSGVALFAFAIIAVPFIGVVVFAYFLKFLSYFTERS